MSKIVFHGSPDKIINFDFTHGVHVGGFKSALEAGSRKLENINAKEDVQQDFIYMHHLHLTVDCYYETDDVGCYENWLVEIERAKKEGQKLIRYKNRYEPDTDYSYIVLDASIIKLVTIEALPLSYVEDELISAYDFDDNFF